MRAPLPFARRWYAMPPTWTRCSPSPTRPLQAIDRDCGWLWRRRLAYHPGEPRLPSPEREGGRGSPDRRRPGRVGGTLSSASLDEDGHAEASADSQLRIGSGGSNRAHRIDESSASGRAHRIGRIGSGASERAHRSERIGAGCWDRADRSGRIGASASDRTHRSGLLGSGASERADRS